MTADLFGAKHVGENYGWVFTAYGVGGIIGPDHGGGYPRGVSELDGGFIIAGVACLVAAVIGVTLKRPQRSKQLSGELRAG